MNANLIQLSSAFKALQMVVAVDDNNLIGRHCGTNSGGLSSLTACSQTRAISY